MGQEPAYVEFVYRVHPDGRREREATVFVRRSDGSVEPATGPLAGAVGRFAEDALREAIHLRRVVIDERTATEGRQGRRGR